MTVNKLIFNERSVNPMKNLSNTQLLESYRQTKLLHLAPEFILLLYKEIEKRDLTCKTGKL